ncbi:MAG TPA: nitroreductase [Bacillota bacterium]|nr:nitroreductase [Bacillota bacterium]
MTDTINKHPSAVEKVIRERRAVKNDYNDKRVTEEVVRDLLEKSIWAPTHGLRQPWNFIFIDKENLPDFAKKVAATYPEERQQNREDYMNIPNAVLIVTMEEPEKQKQWEENYGAVATMIQNFWLLAWELKLGVVWKTNPHMFDPKMKDILNIPDNQKIVGFIHLGYFDEAPEPRERLSIDDKFSTYQA